MVSAFLQNKSRAEWKQVVTWYVITCFSLILQSQMFLFNDIYCISPGTNVSTQFLVLRNC
jgi:hypothetical protein